MRAGGGGQGAHLSGPDDLVEGVAGVLELVQELGVVHLRPRPMTPLATRAAPAGRGGSGWVHARRFGSSGRRGAAQGQHGRLRAVAHRSIRVLVKMASQQHALALLSQK